MDYYLDAWRNFATFTGRASRKQFWMFTLVNIIISVAISLGEVIIGLADFELLSGLYALAVLVPSIAISVRRLHDINKSAWWILWSLLPIIGGLVLLVLFVRKGDEAANRYGVPVTVADGKTRTSPTGETIREAEVVTTKQQQADDDLLKKDLEDK